MLHLYFDRKFDVMARLINKVKSKSSGKTENNCLAWPNTHCSYYDTVGQTSIRILI